MFTYRDRDIAAGLLRQIANVEGSADPAPTATRANEIEEWRWAAALLLDAIYQDQPMQAVLEAQRLAEQNYVGEADRWSRLWQLALETMSSLAGKPIHLVTSCAYVGIVSRADS